MDKRGKIELGSNLKGSENVKEINPRKTIAVEFDIEEFMLLTALLGQSDKRSQFSAMNNIFGSNVSNDLGSELYHQMTDILDRYGIKA